jgi:hypothetical protein
MSTYVPEEPVASIFRVEEQTYSSTLKMEAILSLRETTGRYMIPELFMKKFI